MRRVAAFVIFDVSGDPSLEALDKALPEMLMQLGVMIKEPDGITHRHVVLQAMTKAVGFLSPSDEKARPEPITNVIEIQHGRKH